MEETWESFKRSTFAKWAGRTVVALSVIAAVVITWWAAVRLLEAYWPHSGTLSVEQVLLAWQGVALTLGLASIVLIWRQGKDTARWNKLVLYHQFFDSLPARPEREAFLEELKKRGLLSYLDGIGTPLSEEAVGQLTKEPLVSQVVRVYLDGFEQLCGAVNCGVIDERYAIELERARVVRIFRVFLPLIEAQRLHNSHAYLELEKVATRWIDISKRVDEKYKKELADQLQKLERDRLRAGVKPILQ